jgi:polysaccharide biosynthesis transport protein
MAYQPYLEPPQDESILRRIASLLKSHWLLLAGTVFLCEAIAFVWTARTTPIYRARTSLEIEALNADFLNLRSVDPTAASVSGAGSVNSYIQTQAEILQSDRLLGRVVERLHLHTRPEFLGDQGRAGQVWLTPTAPRERAVYLAKTALRVRLPRESNIVEVFYDSVDRQVASDFLNVLVEEYLGQSLESRWEGARQTGELLRRQLEGVKTKLEASENEFQAQSHAMGILVTDDRNSVAEARLRQVQEELSKAQADRMGKQSQYEMASAMKPDSLPAVLDNGPLREYQLKLSDLRREEAEQSVLLAPTNYKVQRLRAQIKELESAMSEERTNVIGRVRNEYEAAKVREALLSKAYTEQMERVGGLSTQMARYNTLKHTVDSNRALYESMLTKVNDAGLASALRASNVHVIDPATPPAAPSEPNLPLNLGLALVGGFILGNVILVIGESTNSRIKADSNVTHLLHVPQLGTVPSTRLLGGQPVIAAKSPEEPLLVADSFRSIMTSILLAGGATPQVIAITSPGAGDGKTTISLNLARTLASNGQKTLLIEGDPRSGRLQRILGLENYIGLREILSAERPVDELPLNDYTQKTRIPGVFLLSSGRNAADVPVLLYSKRLLRLLERLKRRFNTILIDTPPLLLAPEARICGRLADGVILVLRADRTTRELAVACYQRLDEDGSTILGTVLNDAKLNPNHYAYYNSGRRRHRSERILPTSIRTAQFD